MGGSPVAHRTIKRSIKSIESDLARLVPAAASDFFVLGTGMIVPGRPRERNSSVKLSGGPAV